MLTKKEEQVLIKSYLDTNELEKFELTDDDFSFIKGAVVLIIGIGNRIGRELFGLIRNKGVESFIFVDASEKAMCSDRLVSSRKNTACARPTSKYWIGWIGRLLRCSNMKNAEKLRTMNSTPYFTARKACR